ncbi:MAG: choice-of-anchor J domain-containing protein, partial [Deltaproteobacteria bacterium]|nr:choice-of-anchor J domain-containing protein [Deltaproteobacteria bacterium]
PPVPDTEPLPDAADEPGPDAALPETTEDVPGACPGGCDAGDACFTAACEPAGCAFLPVFSDGCFTPPTVLSQAFEDPAVPAGWTVVDVAKNRPAGQEVVWATTKTRAHSGGRSLHLGAASGGWDTGKRVAAVVKSAPVTPKAGQALALRLWAWADVEDGDLWDVLTVTIETEDGTVPAWVKAYGFPMKQWTEVAVDLSAFAGTTFRVVVGFDSVDDSYNGGEGVYLDDVFVLLAGAAPACEGDADCDDGIACTADSCKAGKCAHDVSDGCCSADVQCDDHDACTYDLCRTGACDHVEVADPACCNAIADCDDDNECTLDSCTKNRCSNVFQVGDGCCTKDAECGDEDACTKDRCQEFRCVHQNTCCQSAKECDDGDDVCTIDDCVAGRCVHAPTLAPGCCIPELGTWTFDDGDGGWVLPPIAGGVGWQVTTATGAETRSPPGALYYGNPASWDYDDGKANSGTARSPWVDVPPGVEASLSMHLWIDIESNVGWDLLTVWVEAADLDDVQVFQKTWSTPQNEWFPIEVDLSAYAGHTVRVAVAFDTTDDSGNYYKGVFVDDVFLATTCLPHPCETDGDCGDGVWKSVEKCIDGRCEYDF